MKTCTNHPDKEAFSVCHFCGNDYCEECLDEGKEFYFCRNPECQKKLTEEFDLGSLQKNVVCPNCESELELSEDERLTGIIHCPECESAIDFRINPPKILDKKNFVELLSSLNQGDISVIKSLLDDSNIEYYVFGENFLGVDPLIQPARFYVNENQLEEAKKLLKDFEFRIWGASNNRNEE